MQSNRIKGATRKAVGHQVFLCYSHLDGLFVRQLHDRLEADGLPAWMDDIHIAPGEHWLQAIETAMEKSQVAVICFGPNGLSPYQETELEIALQLTLDRRLKVIPAILPEVSGEPSLPRVLRGIQFVDFRRSDIDPMERLVQGIRNSLRKGRTNPPRKKTP